MSDPTGARAGELREGFSPRAVVVFWLVLAGLYLTYAGMFSLRAPCGGWRNSVFGLVFWKNSDPGGWYLPSAHHLFSSEHGATFVGHPGLTLQILLQSIQKLFFVFSAERDLTFSQFTAKNISLISIASMLSSTVLHVVSFYLLYLVADKTLKNRRAALLAMLFYATSFPVLFYISRVSVEPLTVVLFLSVCLVIQRCHKHLEDDRVALATVFACLAAGLAVSGFVTKVQMLGPLPLFGVLYLFCGARASGVRTSLPGRTRSMTCLAYVGVAVGTIVLYSQLIDWADFFQYWSRAVRPDPAAAPAGDLSAGAWFALISSTLRGMMFRLAEFPVSSYLPAYAGFGRWNGIFMACEWLFLALSLIGWIVFLVRCPQQRSQGLWLAVYAGYAVLIWGINGHFHYCFLVLAVLSIFGGYLVNLVLNRLSSITTRRSDVARVVVSVLVVHHFSMWAATDSRLRDVAEYQRYIKPYHQALGMIDAGGRIAVITAGAPPPFANIHGLHDEPVGMAGPAAHLAHDFERFFFVYDLKATGDLSPEERVVHLREQGCNVVIDTLHQQRPWQPVTLQQWSDQNR